MLWVIERVLYLCFLGTSTLVPVQVSFFFSGIILGCHSGVNFLIVTVLFFMFAFFWVHLLKIYRVEFFYWVRLLEFLWV